jgi:hypothetical protein
MKHWCCRTRRAAFFDIPMDPPAPHERLRCAVDAEQRRVLPKAMAENAADLRIEALGASHDWAGFACGVESLPVFENAGVAGCA